MKEESSFREKCEHDFGYDHIQKIDRCSICLKEKRHYHKIIGKFETIKGAPYFGFNHVYLCHCGKKKTYVMGKRNSNQD